MFRTVAALALALSMTGCTKDDAPAPPADEAAAGKAADTAAADKAAADKAAADKAAADKAADEAAAKAAGHAIWGTYDTAAELARLEGTWQVRTRFGARAPDTWVVSGDKVTVTHPDGKTELGQLVMPMPGQVGIKTGNSTQYFAYARDGEDLWIGLGDGGVKLDDRYFVAADRGLVSFDGTACRFYKKKLGFGGGEEFDPPVDVKCELQSGGEQTVLHYQTPKFMKDGEFDDHQISVRGVALMNEQLQKEHAVVKGAAAPAEQAQ